LCTLADPCGQEKKMFPLTISPLFPHLPPHLPRVLSILLPPLIPGGILAAAFFAGVVVPPRMQSSFFLQIVFAHLVLRQPSSNVAIPSFRSTSFFFNDRPLFTLPRIPDFVVLPSFSESFPLFSSSNVMRVGVDFGEVPPPSFFLVNSDRFHLVLAMLGILRLEGPPPLRAV